MKYIEVSRKIEGHSDAQVGDVKELLIDKLDRIIDIENVTENLEKFKVVGTTGTPSGFSRHSRIDLDVEIIKQDRTFKILIAGQTRIATSLAITYMLLVIAVLVIGLLPGSIESGEDSGAADALVFLFIGMYIIFDMKSKQEEPKGMLEDVLQSLDTVLS